MKLGTLPPRVAAGEHRRVRPAAKQAAAVYQTTEHRQWRAEVIRRAGGMCQSCGRADGRLFADHVQELRDGGAPLDPGNGRALCGACHTRKTAAARAARARGMGGQMSPTHPDP